MSEESRPDLLEVLEHYNVRTKSRNAYMTNCPLHEDRTPSLSVNIDKGVWSCHSCGKGGDSYTMIMGMEDTDFVGARKLATTLSFTETGDGGGDGGLRGSSYGSRRKAPARKGPGQKDGGYVPRWRRS